MRAILMFHNYEAQSHKIVSTDHNFWRERRAEADSNRGPSAYQPNALPLDQTSSQYHVFISAGLLVVGTSVNEYGVNPFSASSFTMQQLLVPAVYLILEPNVQTLSLNTRNFLILEPIF